MARKKIEAKISEGLLDELCEHEMAMPWDRYQDVVRAGIEALDKKRTGIYLDMFGGESVTVKIATGAYEITKEKIGEIPEYVCGVHGAEAAIAKVIELATESAVAYVESCGMLKAGPKPETNRKVVQVACSTASGSSGTVTTYVALRDDGSIWAINNKASKWAKLPDVPKE